MQPATTGNLDRSVLFFTPSNAPIKKSKKKPVLTIFPVAKSRSIGSFPFFLTALDDPVQIDGFGVQIGNKNKKKADGGAAESSAAGGREEITWR